MDCSFQKGDVVTIIAYDEVGVIDHKFCGEGYDWWVKIEFSDFKTRTLQTTYEPYRNSELKKVENF